MLGWLLAALLAASLAVTTSGLRRTEQPLEPLEPTEQEVALSNDLGGACGPFVEWTDEPERGQAFEWTDVPQRAKHRESATDQDAETQNFTDGSLALPVFKNILLVIHCRASADICREREWVLKKYAPHFGDVFYMTQFNHCALGAADPNVCVARLMETRGAGRDGVLYTHFDALIHPAHLAIDFDKHAFGYFRTPFECKLNETMSLSERCATGGGSPHPRHAIARWREKWEVWGRRLMDDPFTMYIGTNDLFYTPREAFTQFAFLSRAFHPIFHEIAGPNIRATLAAQMNISNNNLFCTGSCMAKLEPGTLLHKNFKCGHKFNMSDAEVERAATEVLDQR